MHCTERDQEILLLQHGELSPWQTFWVKRHLRTCPHCQEKQTEFGRTARLVAGAIRQNAGLPLFVFRGDAATVPTLAPITRDLLAPTRRSYRPVFVATVSVVAAMVAAGAYAYKAMALAPTADQTPVPLTVFQARSQVAPHAKDAQGKPTIFPYSTPNMRDECRKN